MFAAISSQEIRSDGNSNLTFKVDESFFDSFNIRIVKKVETLDGNVVVLDWGFSEGRRQISIKVDLTPDDHDIMVLFNEDNVNSYIWQYKSDAFLVVLREVRKDTWHGSKICTLIKMDVVRKLPADGSFSL